MSDPATEDQPAAPLSWRVLTLQRPGLSPDLPPGQEAWNWVANSVTLIEGQRDAVLVDTFLTIDQSRTLLDWVAASGKRLVAVYVTHGHGDHFFGLLPLLAHFPQARAFALPGVVAAMKAHLSPDLVDRTWRRRFPGQIAERFAVAEPLPGGELELEGHRLVALDMGRTDTAATTSLHAPSAGLIVAGDVVYNGVHPFLGETDRASRRQWIAALDRLETLAPRAVVAGHKRPDSDDDPRHIAATRQYLRDFDRLAEVTRSARDLYDAMLALHPARANPGSLWRGAQAAKARAAG